MADFDINGLLSNPAAMAGVNLLSNPWLPVGQNIAQGMANAQGQQLAPITLALRRLELQRAQKAANFNPADFMQTDQSDYNGLLNGSSQSLQDQSMQPGTTPAAIGGPMGQIPSASAQVPSQGQVNFSPGTPQGRGQLDLPGLVTAGIQAGLPVQDIQAIGMAVDPERYARMQALAKLYSPEKVGPGEQLVIPADAMQAGGGAGGGVIAQNNNPPPSSELGQLNMLTAARDKYPEGSPQWKMLNAAILQKSGQATQQFRQQMLQNTDYRLYGDPQTNERVAQGIASYQLAPASMSGFSSPQKNAIMSRVLEIRPDYNAQNYATSQKAYNAFTSGTQSNTVRSMNVAIEHLQTLNPLIDALQNGDVQAINRLSNAYKAQFGGTAPTNFDAAKSIVSDEVVKAIVGSQNALGDREELKKQLSNAQTPEQLKGVVQTWVNLMGGQLKGLKQQYGAGTMRNDFDEKFLTPNARAALEGTAPRIAVRSGTLNGRKVIQYSDGTTEYVK